MMKPLQIFKLTNEEGFRLEYAQSSGHVDRISQEHNGFHSDPSCNERR